MTSSGRSLFGRGGFSLIKIINFHVACVCGRDSGGCFRRGMRKKLDRVLDLGLGLCLGLGIPLYQAAGRHVASARTTLLLLSEVILAPVWTFAFASEVPTGRTIGGGAVLLLAIVWLTLHPGSQAAEASQLAHLRWWHYPCTDVDKQPSAWFGRFARSRGGASGGMAVPPAPIAADIVLTNIA